MLTRKYAVAEVAFDGSLNVVATYASPAEAIAHLDLASRLLPCSKFTLTEGWF